MKRNGRAAAAPPAPPPILILLLAALALTLTAAAAEAGAGAPLPTYPAMTHGDLSRCLGNVPLYCLSRRSDGGVLLAAGRGRAGSKGSGAGAGGGGKLAYFFLSRETAEANLKKVLEGDPPEEGGGLRVSKASLGKLWGRFFPSVAGAVLGAPSGSGERDADDGGGGGDEGVDFRLVADSDELLRARFLLTITDKDLRGLGEGEDLTAEAGRRLLQKAGSKPAKFRGEFNDIPVFVVPQLRLRRSRPAWVLRAPFARGGRREEGDYLPVYFCMDDLAAAVGQVAEFEGASPGTCVMDLRELLTQLGRKQDSVGFDPRRFVFVPAGGGRRKFGRPIVAEEAYADVLGEGSAGGQEEDSPYVDRRTNWLRPRRGLRQQDMDALFGPDRSA